MTDSAENDAEMEARSRNGLFVIGVGSSAGGLEALTDFVSHLKPTGQLTFVIAQHLAPDHRSLMHELLSRDTGLPIKQLKRSTKPKPDTIYLTPPNRHVVFSGDEINLVEPKVKQGPVPSANSLFSSLARELGENCGAVVLSGTGSDGAMGLEDIKKAGGITCAQDDSAKYDGMPVSARQTDCVDLVASPADLAKRLCNFAIVSKEMVEDRNDGNESTLYESILSIVRTNTKLDFSDYRPPPLLRRMQRRMTLLGVSSHEAYCELLEKNVAESELLANEFMIGVTMFFRDKEAFSILESTIDRIVNGKALDDEIRVWVPACSSGEEAYSFAIMFLEAVRHQGRDNQVRIFATDLDTRGLAVGRRGYYTEILDARIPEEILNRYFTHTEDGYTVNQNLRDAVVFSKHDVIHDPPFSNMDLVSCRNLFIYFNVGLQQRSLERFHYSLKNGGCLFLGRSENIGDAQRLFSTIDKKSRIFSARTGTGTKYRPITGNERFQLAAVQKPLRDPPINPDEFKAYRALAKSLSPPTIVLDPTDRPVHMHGALDPYTQLPSGSAEFHVSNIVRSEFRADVRALITRARRDHVRVSSQLLDIEYNGDRWSFKITVQPYEDIKPEQDHLLVTFGVVSASVPEIPEGDEEEILSSTQNVVELEHELTSLREHMRTLVEELETSNEELQSLNEELQSSNEELQSTNEELETSNEELQATNEELTTVNEELGIRTEEARTSNSFILNILETMDHPVVVTNKKLEILRHNAAASDLLGLDADAQFLKNAVGKGRMRINRTLSDLAFQAVAKNKSYSRQLKSEGNWYRTTARPYCDPDGALAGAIIVIDDVTALKQANIRLKEQQQKLEQFANQQSATLNSLPAHIALVDGVGSIIAVNKAWEDFAAANGLSSEAMCIGENYLDTCDRAAGDMSEEATYMGVKLREVLNGETREFEFRYPCHSPDEKRWFRCVVRAVLHDKMPVGAAVMHIDETQQFILENSLKDAQFRSERANHAKTAFLTNMSHELRTPLNAIIGFSDMQIRKAYGPLGHEKYEEYASDINAEAVRLLDQIEAILDVGKVESGTLELKEANFHPRKYEQSIFKLFDMTLAEKNISATADIPESSPSLIADENMTRQMLVNLVGNATKFTPAGGAIELRASYTNDGWFALVVKDTGIGIAEDRIDEICEPFEQVRSTFTTDNSGVGLGLSVVKSMMNLHNGKLKIESTLGEGAEVSLLFPPSRVVT